MAATAQEKRRERETKSVRDEKEKSETATIRRQRRSRGGSDVWPTMFTVSGFRSLEPRVSDFGSVCDEDEFGIKVKVSYFNTYQVHVTVQLHFGRLRSTQLWFGSTSQHRSALIWVSLGLSSSAGLGAAWFNPVRLVYGLCISNSGVEVLFVVVGDCE
ncbi:uncharacterized protein LOC110889317 isoform X2 [Helianthus annuus]|uniref:uncharacterized protein LOC110889317 isoform X2 n=1 Tax=Helianthus annuus TaxID=4232 RepID=UPI000B8EF6C4|nr:uncharacterized protein LOC110889317 isoform X2 [Helianthus annuus]